MKILCTGDIHIGRRSSRLPAGSDSRHHSCAAAWLRCVDLAIAEAADVLVVTGDLVDQSNRFFEAFGPIEAGLRKLADAGIETLMVAGNHDFDVLPRIIDNASTGAVRLLGRDGAWERVTIERGGKRVHFDGWSFNREHILRSPLESYPQVEADAPVVVLLHADLDQPRSSYAPISLTELRRYPDRIFLLGHVHAMRRVSEDGGASALYVGSPQAMDPGESGDHGVHLLEIARGYPTTFIPLSTVRYEPLEVSVDSVDRLEEVDDVVLEAVRQRLGELSEEPHLRNVHFRIRLVGRTPLHRQLGDRLRDRLVELEVVAGRVMGTVGRVVIDTRPARDLVALAEAGGIPAILARIIGDLGESQGEIGALVSESRQAAREIERAGAFVQVIDGASLADDEDAVKRELSRAAMLLLDEMLAQKDGES